jgi:hypothetical protein
LILAFFASSVISIQAWAGAESGGNTSRHTGKTGAISRYSATEMKHLNELSRKREEEKAGKVTIGEMGEQMENTDS